jgi:hypothetical protein
LTEKTCLSNDECYNDLAERAEATDNAGEQSLNGLIRLVPEVNLLKKGPESDG